MNPCDQTPSFPRFLLTLLLLMWVAVFAACDAEQGTGPCIAFDCSGHGECLVDGSGQTSCRCDEGYVASGMSCLVHDDRCPVDMVAVPELSVCIDRYEATRGDGDVALSIFEGNPWVGVVWEDARAACEAAGKRLCRADEWLEACGGPQGNTYAYGDEYEPMTCNGAGYAPDDDFTVDSGTMTRCEGGYSGLFDMMGNAAEWTDDCADGICHYRGGSFRDADVDYNCRTLGLGAPTVEYRNVGFRCCRSF